MNAKGCNKFAKLKKRLSLRSTLKLAVRIGLLTTSALAVPLALRAATSAIQFTSDFEDGNYNEWRAGEINTPWALKIVPGFGTNTTKVARFEYRNTDVLGYDTVKADLAGTHVPMGSDQWYGFQYFLPDSFKTVGKKGFLIFQTHAGVAKTAGFSGGKPSVYLVAEKDGAGVDSLIVKVNYTPDGRLIKDTINLETNLGPIVKEAWQKVALRVLWEANDSGRIELYINGKLKYTRSGIIGYNDPSGKYEGTYPRIGFYAPNDDKDVSNYPPVSVIYFDDFKMGSTQASVSSGSSSSPPPTDNNNQEIRVEAEEMFLSAYRIESNRAASNGQVLSLLNAIDTTDTASSTFSGGSGKYNVYVGYFDENDGAANLQVSVAGARLADLQLDQNLGGSGANAKTLVRKQVASGLSINKGARIEIKGTANQEEWARVDYIDFIPVP